MSVVFWLGCGKVNKIVDKWLELINLRLFLILRFNDFKI